MKWAKLGSVVWFIMGFIPYIVIGYLVVDMWHDYILEPDLFFYGWWCLPWSHSVGFYVRYILESLTMLGSWAFWWLFCKAIKYLVWCH